MSRERINERVSLDGPRLDASKALEPPARRIARGLAAGGFVVAGVLHFARPGTYERIVPPGFPVPATLVAVSGAAEIAGGVGLLIPRLRRPAGWGLIALLVAVFPANVYMAVRADRFADLGLPVWALWARLPLQGLLIEWVRRVVVFPVLSPVNTREREPESASATDRLTD